MTNRSTSPMAGKTKQDNRSSDPQPFEAKPVTASDAPEENNNSQIPGDNRPPHQLQPPTKDQY